MSTWTRYDFILAHKACVPSRKSQGSAVNGGSRADQETGPRGFTLREAARRAGVSHNAPYRHFRDRNDLLAAVATDGFEKLTAAMQRAARKTGALNRLRRSGLAYVDFALRWPHHFAAMFDGVWDREQYPECADAAQRCFETLLGFVRDCLQGQEVTRGEVERIAYQAWSLVHGVSKLANAGQLPWRSRAAVLRFCAYSMDHMGSPVKR